MKDNNSPGYFNQSRESYQAVVQKQEMAAGNAESVTNGVTGVGRFFWKPACFTIPTLIRETMRFGFLPALTGHSANAAFPAAIDQ